MGSKQLRLTWCVVCGASPTGESMSASYSWGCRAGGRSCVRGFRCGWLPHSVLRVVCSSCWRDIPPAGRLAGCRASLCWRADVPGGPRGVLQDVACGSGVHCYSVASMRCTVNVTLIVTRLPLCSSTRCVCVVCVDGVRTATPCTHTMALHETHVVVRRVAFRACVCLLCGPRVTCNIS